MYKVKKKSGEGCASTFYILSCGTKGFKEYDSKWKADAAHNSQTVLAEHNLAPRVYSEVGKIRKRGKKLSHWGYITELADLPCCAGNDCDCCDRYSLEETLFDEIDTLCSDMLDVNFEFHDNHIGNVGYVERDGERILVCIDTGDESVTNFDGDCTCVLCRNGGECYNA
jgi:hypothetical protein